MTVDIHWCTSGTEELMRTSGTVAQVFWLVVSQFDWAPWPCNVWQNTGKHLATLKNVHYFWSPNEKKIKAAVCVLFILNVAPSLVLQIICHISELLYTLLLVRPCHRKREVTQVHWWSRHWRLNPVIKGYVYQKSSKDWNGFPTDHYFESM